MRSSSTGSGTVSSSCRSRGLSSRHLSIVAIHQPNFFPWLGYFDKIARSDQFVFLDHVQFQKTGGAWSNRVRMMVGGRPQWVTAPINRGFHGTRAVNQIEFAERQPWREQLLKTLASSYGRASYYAETMSCVEPLVTNADNNLARYNATAIRALVAHLGMRAPEWHWSSALGVDTHATELLIGITRMIGGNMYLCGGGAGEYQQDAAFAAAGVALTYQDFQHPPYQQRGGAVFAPGLSIVDALMNCGRDGVRRLLSTAVTEE